YAIPGAAPRPPAGTAAGDALDAEAGASRRACGPPTPWGYRRAPPRVPPSAAPPRGGRGPFPRGGTPPPTTTPSGALFNWRGRGAEGGRGGGGGGRPPPGGGGERPADQGSPPPSVLEASAPPAVGGPPVGGQEVGDGPNVNRGSGADQPMEDPPPNGHTDRLG